jgi:osmotically-inducible protein OsmY
MRGQESAGAYVDDASITSQHQGRMVEDKSVDARRDLGRDAARHRELSGFAKDATEKHTAETIAMKAKGVKSVQNNITVEP